MSTGTHKTPWTWVAYHVTRTPNVESILANGFRFSDYGTGAYFGPGVYFALDEDTAEGYLMGESGFTTVVARITLQNALIGVDTPDEDAYSVAYRKLRQVPSCDTEDSGDCLGRAARQEGYDGIVIWTAVHGDGGNQVVVFNPESIEIIGPLSLTTTPLGCKVRV